MVVQLHQLHGLTLDAERRQINLTAFRQTRHRRGVTSTISAILCVISPSQITISVFAFIVSISRRPFRFVYCPTAALGLFSPRPLRRKYCVMTATTSVSQSVMASVVCRRHYRPPTPRRLRRRQAACNSRAITQSIRKPVPTDSNGTVGPASQPCRI